jgi:hypothetical protein
MCERPAIQIPSGPNIRNVNQISTGSRLLEAVEMAKRKLSEREIAPIIYISGEENCCIVVQEIIREGREYFSIERQSDSTPLFQVLSGKYRYLYFRRLKRCRVYVKCKLLRVFFDMCYDTQISLRAPVVSMVEFLRCSNIAVSIRPEQSDFSIPLTLLELCRNFRIFQSVESLEYLITSSQDISGIIVNRSTRKKISHYEMGKLLWEEQESILISLSISEGSVSIPFSHSLHDVHQHLISLSPKIEPIPEIDFGATPPSASFMNRDKS